jgi:hypothetical protein
VQAQAGRQSQRINGARRPTATIFNIFLCFRQESSTPYPQSLSTKKNTFKKDSRPSSHHVFSQKIYHGGSKNVARRTVGVHYFLPHRAHKGRRPSTQPSALGAKASLAPAHRIMQARAKAVVGGRSVCATQQAAICCLKQRIFNPEF